MKAGKFSWPVLTRYDQQHLGRIAMPIGGIGTGTISLGGRGDLRDWEIVNRPAKGFKPKQTFFALYAKPVQGKAISRALEGIIDPRDFEGAFGSEVSNHGLPRFRSCRFEAAYPFGQVILQDAAVPVDVRIKAWNPFIPAEVDRSSIPIAAITFVLSNKLNQPVDVAVCGNLENFIGQDGTVVVDGRINTGPKQGARNTNVFRKARGAQGLFMQSDGTSQDAEQSGTIALATTASRGVSYRTGWANLNWGDSLLDYWDDFSGDGKLDPRSDVVDNPIGSLSVSLRLPAGAIREVTFLIGWHFPNRLGWGVRNEPSLSYGTGLRDKPDSVKNFYTGQYTDAWDVVFKTAAQLTALERDTHAFVDALCGSDLPAVIKEAALYNASTLRTQTTFRIDQGYLMGWEGCGDTAGCCWGSCTHVWNYEQATAHLFGTLAKGMREVEFKHSTRADGLMAFRSDIALSRASEWVNAAADGQMGCLMKLYRDWQLGGDDVMLKALWPAAKRALQFCWRPGGWDADQDGVMEGCQHNTMDVEYYGPNPQMGTWYLGALRAMAEMARYLNEPAFALQCQQLFEQGSAWMDAHLFNGDYYEHEVRAPRKDDLMLEGLRVGMGALNLDEPDLQLGAGCLVDQLVGQYFAHVCGLGYLLDKRKVQRTLKSIMRFNFKQGFDDHFNHLRSFVLGDERALLMASYPRGRRPKRPFPYYNEVMTGFEYTAAVHMLYEGQTAAGLKAITAIRARYDGQRRNPFDEAECGHHYARAMASWAGILALSGFHYSGVSKTLTFAAKPGRHFWSNGYAWGTVDIAHAGKGFRSKLCVLGGTLVLKSFELPGSGVTTFDGAKRLTKGKRLVI